MHAFQYILERIEQKKLNYRGYAFAETENTAFKTFFDLAQEFDDLDDLYKLCVAVPQAFFGFMSRLYVPDVRAHGLGLVASTGDDELHKAPPEGIHPAEKPYYTEQSLVLTIHGKKGLMEQLPIRVNEDILGILEIYPAKDLDPHGVLFFEKYANRMGFNIHNRFLAERNVEHLRFIRTLVADIEHNIIAPNMVYKLYLRDLKDKISNIKDVEGLLADYCREAGVDPKSRLRVAIEDLREASRGLQADFENIERHYRNMSLFLETLLRRSHFDKGRLVLRTKRCNMYKDIIRPQLERYSDKLRAMGIVVDFALSGIPEEEAAEVVDVGLMAQVYANLFSNAVKYAHEVTMRSGEKQKSLSFGHEIIRDYFGPGMDGSKYNVFSSGPHLEVEESKKLFTEGFRGRNALETSGTGHGLSFIKNVIELHGGVVGYEAVEGGNNFYFIIPRH